MIDAFTQHAIPVVLAWQRMSRRATSVAYTMRRAGLITFQEYDEIERNIVLLSDNVPPETDLVSDLLVRHRFVTELILITPCLQNAELEDLFGNLMRRAANLPAFTGFTLGDRMEGFLRDAQIQHWREVATISLFTAGLTILALMSNAQELPAAGLALGLIILAMAFASFTLIRPWN